MIECINQNQLKSWEKSTKLPKPKNHNQINFNSFCFVDFIYLRKCGKTHHELFVLLHQKEKVEKWKMIQEYVER